MQGLLSSLSRLLKTDVQKVATALRCCLAISGFVLLFAPASVAQTVKALPIPAPLTNVVQGSDGNFYGPTVSNRYTAYCDGYTTSVCGDFYRIAPDGTATDLFTLPNKPMAPDGNTPNPLVLGPDGYLYGTTANEGGSYSNCGTFFKEGAGSFTLLHTFVCDVEFGAPAMGGIGGYGSTGPLLLASDGNFYGVAVGGSSGVANAGVVYKITADGTFTRLHTFLHTVPDDGFIPNSLVQGFDGNFYGTTQPVLSGTGQRGQNGTIFQMTPSGSVTTLATFPVDGSLGTYPSSLIQGPDGSFYGVTRGASYNSATAPVATVFHMFPNGQLVTLFSFQNATSGLYPSSALIFGSDGNLYGTAPNGGDATSCTNVAGCGVLFRITPSGTFTVLQAFHGGTGGAYPAALLQGSDGALVALAGGDGSSGSPAAVLFSLNAGLNAPIQMQFTDASGNVITGSGAPNTPLTLTYKVPGAYSLSASQCYASVQPDAQGNVPAAAGTWTGKQSGTIDATGFHGSAQVTPTTDGTYTYALTCGGTTSGFVTLNLSSKLQITSASLPDGSVAKSYSNLTLIDGGKKPYKFVADGLPPGIAIDPASGLLAGKPTQYGTYQVTIAVQDSSTPALTAGRVLPLTIDKSLQLSGSLKSATVGTQYTGGFSATGGYNAYKWTVSAGTLPEGLALNPTTGVISGKPTKAEQATFSITVTDGENPVDTVTLATSLSTVAPPLMVIGGDFVDCTVGVLCDNQFEASGGTPPYTWTVAPGATLPAGMTLASDGSFSFKPIQYYDLPFQIEVQVSDSSKPALTATGIDALTITSSLKANPYTLPVATVGQAYAAPAPIATGGLPPYTWIIYISDPAVKHEYGAPGDGSLYSPMPETAGTFTITYTLQDSEKNQAVVTFSTTLTVVAPLIPTTTTLSASNSTAGTGMNVTLTASLTRSAGVPTGRVTFYNGPAVLGVANLDVTGSASLTASFGAAGSYSLTAQYSGDAGFAGSVSPALTETVVTPAVTATANPATLIVTSGKSGTLTLSLSGSGGYSGTVTFTCGTLPSHVSCSFAPPSITLSSTVSSGSSTLTVSTGPTSTALSTRPGMPGRRAPLELAGLLGLTLLCTSRRTSLRLLQLSPMALLLIPFAALIGLGLSGCGATSSNASPGKYTVPVNVVVGSATVQTVNVSVQVTQQ